MRNGDARRLLGEEYAINSKWLSCKSFMVSQISPLSRLARGKSNLHKQIIVLLVLSQVANIGGSADLFSGNWRTTTIRKHRHRHASVSVSVPFSCAVKTIWSDGNSIRIRNTHVMSDMVSRVFALGQRVCCCCKLYNYAVWESHRWCLWLHLPFEYAKQASLRTRGRKREIANDSTRQQTYLLLNVFNLGYPQRSLL